MGFEHQQLAQKILDQITMSPERHNQGDWASVEECGTTFCIAGWATELTVGTEVYITRLGFTGVRPKDCDKDFDQIGTEALGLSDDDANALFYHSDDEEAVMVLKYLANGEPIDWKAVRKENEQ